MFIINKVWIELSEPGQLSADFTIFLPLLVNFSDFIDPKFGGQLRVGNVLLNKDIKTTPKIMPPLPN